MRSELLVLGGRSGVGKSTVAAEVHHLLARADVRHAVIEGDALDLAHPPPWEHGVAERHLAHMWATYRSLGYSRLVYTNTVSVLTLDALTAAMGDDPRVTAVLLTAGDAVAAERLPRREVGSALAEHLERGTAMAHALQAGAGSAVHRVSTDGRSVHEVATEVLGLAGWLG